MFFSLDCLTAKNLVVASFLSASLFGCSKIRSELQPTSPSPTTSSTPIAENNATNVKNGSSKTVPSSECKEDITDDEKRMLAEKIVKYMQRKSYDISSKEGEINIVYIEGACANGNANADESDQYNDRRIVFSYENDKPTIVGNWKATTEPGTYWRYKTKEEGAPMIAFDQFTSAWQVGIHQGPSNGSSRHEGLIQVKNVTITRDKNRDGRRNDGMKITGSFGINHHRGSIKDNKVGIHAGGCLVGQDPKGHVEFMNIVKSDIRYKGNQKFLFSTTVINGDWFTAFN